MGTQINLSVPDFIIALASRLRTQDSDCTADPIFVVEKASIITGFDTDYCDVENIVWCIEDSQLFSGDSEFLGLEAIYETTGKEPDDWTRTGFIKQWDLLQPFFTQAAADEFISKHGHKYDCELRVSIDSAYRNDEWQQVINWLASIEPPKENEVPS